MNHKEKEAIKQVTSKQKKMCDLMQIKREKKREEGGRGWAEGKRKRH